MKKRFLAGVLSVCFFLSPLSFASTSDSICSYFEALTLIQQQKFAEGLKKYYKFLLFSDPLLSVESRKNDLQDAKTFFDNRNSLSPNDPQTKLYLSLYDRITQDWEPACAVLDELLGKFRKSNLLHFFKGEYLLAQSKNEEALQTFQMLKNKEGSKLWVLAGVLQKKYGVNIDRAERKRILLRKGLRHLDLFENEEAMQVLRQVMTEYPEEPRAPHELMDLFIRENKLREAEEVLAEWRKIDPEGRELYFPEARLKFKQGRYREVLKILVPILSTDPQNGYIQFMIAESSFMSGEYAKSLELLPSLQESDPENIGLLFRRTAALEMTNSASDAVALLKGILEVQPENIPINLELGSVYERMGDYQNARSSYLTAVNGMEAWGALAQKRFDAVQDLKMKGQSNSDKILATMFLGAKEAEKEPTEVSVKPPSPVIERILEDQKEILDILFQK